MPRLLKILLLAAFLNTLSWIILMPLWQYPDEQAHFAQVQDLAELGNVPISGPNTSYEIALSEEILGTERDGQNEGINKFTYHPEYMYELSNSTMGPHEEALLNMDKSARINLIKRESTLNPPLYYKMAALTYGLFSNASLFTRVFIVRIFSALLFMCLITVAFKIGRLVFENNKLLPFFLAGTVAFKPMLVFVSTGVLPDVLTNLLFSIILFLSFTILKNGLGLKIIVLTILTILIGTFTRQQFLISVPIVFLAVIINLFKEKKISPIHIKLTLLVIGIYLLSSFISPLKSILNIAEIDNLQLGSLFQKGFFDFSRWTMQKTISQTWPWYWGNYRWLSFSLPPFVYQIINRLVFIAAVGLVLGFAKALKDKKFSQTEVAVTFSILASIGYFLIFLIWDYFFWLDHGFSFGIQGRYFFPLIIAHFAILTYGFYKFFDLFFRKYSPLAMGGLVILIFIFNFISLYYLVSSYYDTGSLTSFVNQASQYKPSWAKGYTVLIFPIITVLVQAIFLTALFNHAKTNR